MQRGDNPLSGAVLGPMTMGDSDRVRIRGQAVTGADVRRMLEAADGGTGRACPWTVAYRRRIVTAWQLLNSPAAAPGNPLWSRHEEMAGLLHRCSTGTSDAADVMDTVSQVVWKRYPRLMDEEGPGWEGVRP